MSPADLVTHAAGRGVRLQAVGGVLRCLSAGPLPDDLRAALATRKAELLAHLSEPRLKGGQPWDRRVALRLMEAADALVERLGVDGRHPAVAGAAAMITSAYVTRDVKTVRFACAEFEAVVRGLGADRARRAGMPTGTSER
jgi:hypothetical protein